MFFWVFLAAGGKRLREGGPWVDDRGEGNFVLSRLSPCPGGASARLSGSHRHLGWREPSRESVTAGSCHRKPNAPAEEKGTACLALLPNSHHPGQPSPYRPHEVLLQSPSSLCSSHGPAPLPLSCLSLWLSQPSSFYSHAQTLSFLQLWSRLGPPGQWAVAIAI